MNFYIAAGTYDYLKKVKEKFNSESMVLMVNPNSAILIHETEGDTIFNEPRKYEVINAEGSFHNGGFVSMNNIPVTDEGRPLFEYQVKNYLKTFENYPGIIGIRVLRPKKSDTYIVLIVWKDEQSYDFWKNSHFPKEIYEKKAHKKFWEKIKDPNIPKIYPRPSYHTKYYIPKEDE